MLYNSSVIDTLAGRIGFEKPVPPTAVVLDADLVTPTSGRFVTAFHPLATVDNIWMCMSASLSATVGANPDNVQLSAYLQKVRKQSVMKILSRVFDNNDRAMFKTDSLGNQVDISGVDHSDRIISAPARFDDAIGYQLAYDILFLLLTSTRSNIRQRLAADAGMIKMEMEGVVDENGKRVAPGLSQRLSTAISNISDALFPKVQQKTYLNAVQRW